MLNAEILAIGSEMLTPFRTDTNSLWLTERLNSVGIEVRLKIIVGDDEARLEETIRDAMKRSEVIISTGGLGPTADDITKKIFARVLGRRLALNEEVLETIRARFARRNMKMPEINSRQALIPEGAEVLPNPRGTAPGILMNEGNCTIVMLPGPPSEMTAMFDGSVMPVLRRRVGDMVIVRRSLSIFGMSESGVDEIAEPIYGRYTNPSTTILANNGQIELHLTAQARSAEAANRLLDEVAGPLEEVLGEYVFSLRGESLEEVVGQLLKIRGYTLATAESCTGGLLAGRITSVPGSSDYFLEGVVSYANEAKVDLLGVPHKLIEEHGAVSAEVAEAMALGIRHRAHSTIGVGITGIAGPGGGTEEKPVGLVFIGIADEVQSSARKFLMPGDRHLIRELSVKAALDMIRRRISGMTIDNAWQILMRKS
ncbi:MAG TPA: competence/damage-inducible protein A [Blastocatellia bacterium]|nr:competence/damage-inducible protein A [Blastocatellia bacterium]